MTASSALDTESALSEHIVGTSGKPKKLTQWHFTALFFPDCLRQRLLEIELTECTE
ncbi:hypothetical protein [Vibrio alfacsensis]|uniref:hypothetical protein n=1 Tax=Vibrio alfacsensis TaxID=1074311 RepID=UPI004069439D